MTRSFVPFSMGILGLLLGTGIYLFNRPVTGVYLLAERLQFNPQRLLPGPWADHLPSFLHAFAFALITASVGGRFTRARLAASGLLWAGIGTVFELAQHPVVADSLVELARQLGGPSGPFLNLTRTFQTATFDPGDLLHVLLGATTALLMGCLLISRRESHE